MTFHNPWWGRAYDLSAAAKQKKPRVSLPDLRRTVVSRVHKYGVAIREVDNKIVPVTPKWFCTQVVAPFCEGEASYYYKVVWMTKLTKYVPTKAGYILISRKQIDALQRMANTKGAA